MFLYLHYPCILKRKVGASMSHVGANFYTSNTVAKLIRNNPDLTPHIEAAVTFTSKSDVDDFLGSFVGLRVGNSIITVVRAERGFSCLYRIHVISNGEYHYIGEIADPLVFFPTRSNMGAYRILRAHYFRLMTEQLKQRLHAFILRSHTMRRVRRHRLFDRNVLISVLAGYLQISSCSKRHKSNQCLCLCSTPFGVKVAS